MQREKGKNHNPKQAQPHKTSSRVISIRAWRAKKRIQYVRGSRNWGKYLLSVLGLFCACAAMGLALLSCIPFGGQVHAIVIAWFVGIIGCCIGLVLHVFRDRLAARVLMICTSGLALSFVAAMAKFMSITR